MLNCDNWDCDWHAAIVFLGWWWILDNLFHLSSVKPLPWSLYHNHCEYLFGQAPRKHWNTVVIFYITTPIGQMALLYVLACSRRLHLFFLIAWLVFGIVVSLLSTSPNKEKNWHWKDLPLYTLKTIPADNLSDKPIGTRIIFQNGVTKGRQICKLNLQSIILDTVKFTWFRWFCH